MSGSPVTTSVGVGLSGRSPADSSSAAQSHGAIPIKHSDVPEFVRRSVQEAAAVHGLSAEAAAAYCDLCRILVVEVVNDNVRNLACHRRLAGQLGGLNKAKLPYVKKFVLAVDGPQGVYGAADLHRNVHYQIGVKELPSFCRDLEDLGVPLFDGSASVSADLPDCCAVLCPPNRSCFLPDEYFSLASTDFVSDACSEVVKELRPADIFRHLTQLQGDSLDPERGNLALHYGFQSMNVTDTSRDDLCGFAAPTLAQPEGSGWSSNSLKDDLGSAMAAMTSIADLATAVHGMDPLFGSPGDDRSTKYAHLIDPANRAESLTASLSPPDSHDGARYLLAHLDHLNDHADGYQYNVSYYGYFLDPATGQYRRIHVGIYSRRVCGTTAARSSKAAELYDDLVDFLAELPRELVEYSHEAIFDGVDEWMDADTAGLTGVASTSVSQSSAKASGRRRVHSHKFLL